jgi:hypothetical protein
VKGTGILLRDEIASTVQNSVAKDIIEGPNRASKGNSSLMYEWHGKKYWGAAHGLAGIMHILMHTELRSDEQDDVKNTL